MAMTLLVGLVDVVQWTVKALLPATLATDVAIRKLFGHFEGTMTCTCRF
jgi:hypothetical protein